MHMTSVPYTHMTSVSYPTRNKRKQAIALDNKLDKLTLMMSKLSTQGSNQNRPFKPIIMTEEREDKVEIIIMIQTGNRIGLH